MNIKFPKEVEEIINDIYKCNKEAFIVGGCVRDSILGIKPNDYDVTTSATPLEIIDIFKDYKVIETGIKHGTVTIIKNNSEYEVTTYRIDGEYNDNRRPDYVEFTKDITKDLQRRDFTINAMAYNHKIGLVDEFEGIKDLEKRLIKTVGVADERFNEDSLRIIRAVRFSSKLGFDIEEDTLKSIYRNMELIRNVSVERIQQELNKILISENPEKIYILYDAGMFKYIGLNNVKIEKSDLYKLKKCKNDIKLRLVVLIYIMSNKKESIKILDILKYSNEIKDNCTTLLNYIDDDIKCDKLNIKLYLNKIGKSSLMDIIYLKVILKNCLKNEYEDNYMDRISKIIEDIEINNECYTLKGLELNGNDLKNLGYEGKEIGSKLNEILYIIMKEPRLNNKENLIELLKYV